MRIGILGTGNVARSLATGFAKTGHTVRLGGRESSKAELADWLRTAGPSTSAGTFAEAAEFGELLVLATKGTVWEEVVTRAGPARFDGKVVIDVTNPLEMHEQGMPTLSVGHRSSAGELLQAKLPKAKVVKAFNIVGNELFFQPKLPGGPPTMILAGNDAGAKATVRGLLMTFGWPEAIDIGGIEGSRELESLCILWVKCAFSLQNFGVAFKLLQGPTSPR
jgi:predicted dinucleotide-binding enzyme